MKTLKAESIAVDRIYFSEVDDPSKWPSGDTITFISGDEAKKAEILFNSKIKDAHKAGKLEGIISGLEIAESIAKTKVATLRYDSSIAHIAAHREAELIAEAIRAKAKEIREGKG